MENPAHRVEDPAAHYRAGLNVTTMLERVRQLRERATPAEAMLWELLRGRRFMGLKFRRQHQYGGYILDFYCAEMGVAVELDGEIHREAAQRERDRIRDDGLRDEGIVVVRFANWQLVEETEEVLRGIWEVCR